MIRLMAYKFRLYSDPRAESLYRRFAGCRRYVWNRALAMQNERHEKGEKRLGFAALCKELTKWRNNPETAWLSESPSQTQQQALRDLDRAFVNFFEKRADRPRFKKKGKSLDSFRYPDPNQFAVEASNGRVKLPKVGWVRYRNSRKVGGSPKQVTVSRDGDHWNVSILVEQDVPDPVHPAAGIEVGIDVGVKNLVALSDGGEVPPLNAGKFALRRLAGLQRVLARKQKFSGKWKRVKRRIAQLHRRTANRRKDYLHKLTTAVSKNHATVYVEDLRVRNMSASAKGTVESPGRNVRQKAGLNRAILDQSWGELVRQLDYKLAWRGGRLARVNPAFTSQTCPDCGHVAKENRPTRDRFQCVGCGLSGPADTVAARNVLAAGQAASMPAGGRPSRGSSPRLRSARQPAGAAPG